VPNSVFHCSMSFILFSIYEKANQPKYYSLDFAVCVDFSQQSQTQFKCKNTVCNTWNNLIHTGYILLKKCYKSTHCLLFPGLRPSKDRIRWAQQEIWSLLRPQNSESTSFFLTSDLRCHTIYSCTHTQLQCN